MSLLLPLSTSIYGSMRVKPLLAESEGLEPSRRFRRYLSRVVPYQLGELSKNGAQLHSNHPYTFL